MKNYSRFITLASAVMFSLAVHAQNQYTVKMNMHIEGLPPEYSAMADMDMVTYVKGDKMKTETTGMMGSSVTYFDGTKLTSLNDQMGNKFGYTATKEEIEAGDKNDKSEKPKIEYTTETKNIAGYECTKAIVTSVDKDKKEKKMTVWTTDKLTYAHRGIVRAQGRGGMDLSELKGYPLAMESSENRNGQEMKFVIAATDVSTAAVDDAVFNVSTEGYKMMTYKEMLEKRKAMGGGMGK